MESDNAHAMMNEQRLQATATVVADMLAYDRELLELNWRAQTDGLPVESGVTHSLRQATVADVRRASGAAQVIDRVFSEILTTVAYDFRHRDVLNVGRAAERVKHRRNQIL